MNQLPLVADPGGLAGERRRRRLLVLPEADCSLSRTRSRWSPEGQLLARGVFYWNPEDSSIFVPKRVGIGYTVNFANKWSWAALAGILLAALLPVFLLTGNQ